MNLFPHEVTAFTIADGGPQVTANGFASRVRITCDRCECNRPFQSHLGDTGQFHIDCVATFTLVFHANLAQTDPVVQQTVQVSGPGTMLELRTAAGVQATHSLLCRYTIRDEGPHQKKTVIPYDRIINLRSIPAASKLSDTTITGLPPARPMTVSQPQGQNLIKQELISILKDLEQDYSTDPLQPFTNMRIHVESTVLRPGLPHAATAFMRKMDVPLNPVPSAVHAGVLAAAQYVQTEKFFKKVPAFRPPVFATDPFEPSKPTSCGINLFVNNHGPKRKDREFAPVVDYLKTTIARAKSLYFEGGPRRGLANMARYLQRKIFFGAVVANKPEGAFQTYDQHGQPNPVKPQRAIVVTSHPTLLLSRMAIGRVTDYIMKEKGIQWGINSSMNWTNGAADRVLKALGTDGYPCDRYYVFHDVRGNEMNASTMMGAHFFAEIYATYDIFQGPDAEVNRAVFYTVFSSLADWCSTGVVDAYGLAKLIVEALMSGAFHTSSETAQRSVVHKFSDLILWGYTPDYLIETNQTATTGDDQGETLHRSVVDHHYQAEKPAVSKEQFIKIKTSTHFSYFGADLPPERIAVAKSLFSKVAPYGPKCLIEPYVPLYDGDDLITYCQSVFLPAESITIHPDGTVTGVEASNRFAKYCPYRHLALREYDVTTVEGRQQTLSAAAALVYTNGGNHPLLHIIFSLLFIRVRDKCMELGPTPEEFDYEKEDHPVKCEVFPKTLSELILDRQKLLTHLTKLPEPYEKFGVWRHPL